GGTGMLGCRVTMVLTPVHAWAALHDEIPVSGSPSSHTSPTFLLASAGHAVVLPSHVSGTSHASAAGRHSWPAGRKLHVVEQQTPGDPFADPRSHASPGSRAPFPHGLGGIVVLTVDVVDVV